MLVLNLEADFFENHSLDFRRFEETVLSFPSMPKTFSNLLDLSVCLAFLKSSSALLSSPSASSSSPSRRSILYSCVPTLCSISSPCVTLLVSAYFLSSSLEPWRAKFHSNIAYMPLSLGLVAESASPPLLWPWSLSTALIPPTAFESTIELAHLI